MAASSSSDRGPLRAPALCRPTLPGCSPCRSRKASPWRAAYALALHGRHRLRRRVPGQRGHLRQPVRPGNPNPRRCPTRTALRTMYSVESPESWFEDFGEARLTGGLGDGQARQRLRRCREERRVSRLPDAAWRLQRSLGEQPEHDEFLRGGAAGRHGEPFVQLSRRGEA